MRLECRGIVARVGCGKQRNQQHKLKRSCARSDRELMKPKRMKNAEPEAMGAAMCSAKMPGAKRERARYAVGESVKGAVDVVDERRKRSASGGGQVDGDWRGGVLMRGEDV